MDNPKTENHFNYKEFGKRVKRIRQQTNISTNQLGNGCNLDPAYIRQIESGSKLPSLPTFVKICNNLEVSPSYFLENEIPVQTLHSDWDELSKSILQISPVFRQLINEILCSLTENLTEIKKKKENYIEENNPIQFKQKEFGRRLYKVREEMQSTPKELAKNCGISTAFISQIESGNKLPSLSIFVTICNTLHVSPNYLLGEELKYKSVKCNWKELEQIQYHMTPMAQKITADIIHILIRNFLKILL